MNKEPMWSMEPYGDEEMRKRGGRWRITNGHISFEVHVLINGSGRLQTETPLREPGPRYWIVTPEEADQYAQKILDALNTVGVKL